MKKYLSRFTFFLIGSLLFSSFNLPAVQSQDTGSGSEMTSTGSEMTGTGSSSIQLLTSPVGLNIVVEDTTVNTPYSVMGEVGEELILEAPKWQISNNELYSFEEWSDGSDNNERTVSFDDEDATYTANYEFVDDGDNDHSNLIVNPSFEITDEEDMPIGWSVNITGDHDGKFTISEDAHTGSGSALMEATNIVPAGENENSPEVRLNHASIDVKPGVVYEIRYFYKSDITTPVLLDVTNQSGPNDYPYLGINEPVEEWTEKIWHYKTASNVDSFFLNLYLRDTGYFQVDNVSIIETDLSGTPRDNRNSNNNSSFGRVLGDNDKDFEDVPESHIFHKYIEELARENVIDGYSDGTFRPDQKITRAELAKLVVLGLNFRLDLTKDGDQGVPFPDVDVNSEFYKYIHTLKNMWAVSGYSDGEYKMEEYVNRGQVAKIIAGVLPWKGVTLNTKETYKNNFPDIDKNHTFYNQISILSNYSISGETVFKGYSDGEFKPDEGLTRGQVAKLLWLSRQAAL